MAALKLSTKKYLPFVAALFVTTLSLALFIFLGTLEKERDFHRYRSYAFSSLNIISERLQNVLNSRLIPIEGLSAYISIHPEITKKEFNDFARQIMARQKDQYWGLTQAIITTDSVFEEAGLYDKTSDFNFAIRGKDATGASGDVFFGNKDIFQLNPNAA